MPRASTRNNTRLGVAVFICLVLALPAVAQTTDPYQSDPIDLIAYRDETRTYSSGADNWEVWVCDVPDGTVAVTPAAAATLFNSSIRPYFETISSGDYSPRFVAAATVVASQPSDWPDQPFRFQSECESLVRNGSSGGSKGAIIVVDADYTGGYATGGVPCFPGSVCATTYPQNARLAVVGGSTAATVGGVAPALRTVAHEIGHALFWPHSFGGLVDFEGTIVYEYDNPMDVMSGGDRESLDIGTIGVNRYASGWLDPTELIFHRGGSFSYTLSATTGLQLIVLPTEVPGVYETIGVRLRIGADAGLPAEGVEVYRIDQSPAACGFQFGGQCVGADRRTMQVPAVADPAGIAHVHGVGSTFVVRSVNFSVDARTGDGFRLTLSGNSVDERFVDDNGNPHEPNIAFIADLGITRGCNPPTVDRFCPANNVTRAEMAALLLTAIGQPAATGFTGTFSDVPAGIWYAPYVEALAALGITTGLGNGTYGPNLLVSRAEMAVFLARAFALPVGAGSTAFTDVTPDQWYAAAVEAIRGAGVTTGCATDPARYCPFDAVKRDQMATFLARALQ
ncbi:MAG: S-layer homology domain-containing protein [Acidimicrobiia bacterium]